MQSPNNGAAPPPSVPDLLSCGSLGKSNDLPAFVNILALLVIAPFLIPDYTTPGKLNMDVENQLLDPLRNASAAEHEREPAQTLSASPPSTGVEIVAHERAFDARVTHRFLPAHCKYKKIIGIVVFHLIFGCILFFLGTLVPLNHPQDAIDCPPDWFGYKGHCYSFSKEEKNWKESQNVCISHTASLAKITEEEMAIVQMFTRDHVFWIGLKRQPGQPWKWLDGENAT
ncbi:hypothetical protein E2320_014685 [Naja naja]|nr:hypothetical protein E2320_014685 [Naja naja]